MAFQFFELKWKNRALANRKRSQYVIVVILYFLNNFKLLFREKRTQWNLYKSCEYETKYSALAKQNSEVIRRLLRQWNTINISTVNIFNSLTFYKEQLNRILGIILGSSLLIQILSKEWQEISILLRFWIITFHCF